MAGKGEEPDGEGEISSVFLHSSIAWTNQIWEAEEAA